MRVLVVASRVPPQYGGAETAVAAIERAARARHEVATLLPVEAPFSPPWAQRAVEVVRAAAARTAAELVHLTSMDLAFLAPGLTSLLPVVVTAHGDDVTVRGGDGGPAAGCAATATSRFVARRAMHRGLPSPVLLLPPAVDLDWFRPGDRGLARRRLGIPGDSRVILTVGRMTVERGYIDLLAALAHARDPSTLWIGVGMGVDRERIAGRAAFARLADQVILPGALEPEALRAVYQAADVFAAPSRHDAATSGLALLEAAACGLPVVASDSGPLPERIIGGRTGLLVPAGDAAALGGALAALLDDTDRRAELGAAGRDHATRAAHPDGLASRLDEVYAAAARRWRRPARPRRSGSGRSAPAREASRARAAGDRMAVLMPTFQCRRWLPRAIEAVLGQTWRPLDLYVADDASGDVDADLAARYPSVTFLRLRARGGPYRIANLLLSLTDSELVAFHDADDWSTPDRLATQVAYLRERGFAGCGSWYGMVETTGDPIGFATPPELASISMREVLGDQVLHPTSLYRREVFDRLGGFDGETRFSGDTEFHYRAALTFELGNVQRFLYRRTVRPESLTQHPDTAINSPARSAYLDRVRAAARDAFSGAAPAPAEGTVLLGHPVRAPHVDDVEWWRVGAGNVTLRRPS